MISEYFSYNYNFDHIVRNDPTNNDGTEYWHLNTYPKQNFCWNTNIFSDKEIERIIVIGKRLSPKRAQTGGRGEDCLDQRRSFISWIGANSETEWIFRKITDVVKQNNQQCWNFDLEKIERLQFTHYLSSEEGTYHSHRDPIQWTLPHNRKLSMSLQLSDPKDYEGGDLLLHFESNPTVISKQKGMMVFFPSHTLHEVTPVTKGERFSLVAWIHGPNLR
jgi:PKHD-type hydroxylase